MAQTKTDLTTSNPVAVVPAQTVSRCELFAMGSFVGLNDGRLVYVMGSGVDKTYISQDGGQSWQEQGALHYVDGSEIKDFHAPNLMRLKSGRIGMVYSASEPDQHWAGLLFARSDDETKTWSKPIRLSEPHLDHVALEHDAAIVTSSGRMVVPVYRGLGRRDFVPDKKHFFAVALLGDEWSLAGSHGFEPTPEISWVYYSDDEGQTWHRNANGEMMITLDYEAGGNWSAEEPVIVEYAPKHLLMLYRTPLGRLFQSWSKDDGSNWTMPRPTALAASRAPAALKRIPGTNDLLVVWNQASGDEIQRGLLRHRLSAAISQDGGASWKRHKNISCIDQDDRSYIEPSPIRYYRAESFSPRLPLNHCWATYPAVTFCKDRVVLTYIEVRKRMLVAGDLENPVRNENKQYAMTLPISWLYEKAGSP